MRDVDLPADEATRNLERRPFGVRAEPERLRCTMATTTAAARKETRVA
jgi:hypothetical protein